MLLSAKLSVFCDSVISMVSDFITDTFSGIGGGTSLYLDRFNLWLVITNFFWFIIIGIGYAIDLVSFSCA